MITTQLIIKDRKKVIPLTYFTAKYKNIKIMLAG